MSKKTQHRVHRRPLDATLAEALLRVPSLGRHGGNDAVTERLERARNELTAAVAEANANLKTNPIADIVARATAKDLGRRGVAKIVVDPDGVVMLEVHYKATAPKDTLAGPRKWDSILLSLAELRAEADRLNIDHASMGRSKKKIAAAIMAHGQPATTPDPPKPALKLKSDPPQPVKKNTDPFGDDEDLSSIFGGDSPDPNQGTSHDGSDLDEKLQAGTLDRVGPDRPPKPKATPKAKGQAKKIGGRSLSQIAADDVDIDAILAKPAPATPPE